MDKEVKIAFKVDGLDGYITDLEDLKKALGDVDDATKEVSESTDDIANNSKKGGKNLSKMGQLGVKAFKGLKTAIAATGIGLLLAAIGSLVEMFTKTDTGAKILAATSATLGLAFEKISSLVMGLKEPIEKLFKDPKQALIDFGNAIKDNIVSRFEGILNFIPSMASAIENLFKGNFKEAGKIAFDAVAQVTTGVEGASDKIADMAETVAETVSEIVTEVTEVVNQATAMVDAQNRLKERTAELTVEQAKLNKELETQQRIADDTTLSYEERKAALDRVNAANEQLAANAVEQAQLERDALQRAYDLASTDEERRELKQQLADATATLIDAETQAELVRLESAQLNRELDEEEQARLDEIQEQNKKREQEEADRKAKAREEELKAIQEQNEAIAKAEEELQDVKFAAASQGINALSQLAGENERLQNALFLVDKAVAAGKVIVDSVKAKAANVAYAASLGPAGPAYLTAANQAVNINTAASLATLAATTIAKFKSGTFQADSQGGNSASPSPSSAINYNFAQNAGGEVQLGQGGGVSGQLPVMTYVLASDVTNAQQAQAQIQNLARL
jgi:hypothetical protein